MKINSEENNVLNGIGKFLKFKSIDLGLWRELFTKFGVTKYSYDFLYEFYNEKMIPYYEKHNKIENWVGSHIESYWMSNSDISRLVYNSENIDNTIEEIGIERVSQITRNTILNIFIDNADRVNGLTKFFTIFKLFINKWGVDDYTVFLNIVRSGYSRHMEYIINSIVINKNYIDPSLCRNILRSQSLIFSNPINLFKIIIRKLKGFDRDDLIWLFSTIKDILLNGQSFASSTLSLDKLLSYFFQHNKNVSKKSKDILIGMFGSPTRKIKSLLKPKLNSVSIDNLLYYEKNDDRRSKLIDSILTKHTLDPARSLDDDTIERLIKYSYTPELTADRILKFGNFKNANYFCWSTDFICPGLMLLLKFCSIENKRNIINEIMKDNTPKSHRIRLTLEKFLPEEMDNKGDLIEQMDDSEIHQMMSTFKNPQQTAKKIITHRKGRLTKNNVFDLLLYSPDTLSISKLIGKNKIELLSDSDIEELIYNAVDSKIENTLSNFVGDKKINNIIKGNLEPINESTTTNEKLMSYIISVLSTKLRTTYDGDIDKLGLDIHVLAKTFITQIKNHDLVYETILKFIFQHGNNSLESYPYLRISYKKIPTEYKKSYLRSISKFILGGDLSWEFEELDDDKSIDFNFFIDILLTTKSETFFRLFRKKIYNRIDVNDLIFSLVRYKSLMKLKYYVDMVMDSITYNSIFHMDIVKIIKNISKIPDRIKKYILELKIYPISFRKQYSIYLMFDPKDRSIILPYLNKINDKSYKIIGSFQGHGKNELALVKDKKTDKYGYVDQNGEIIVKTIFDAISAFNSYGMAKGKIVNKIYRINNIGRIVDDKTSEPLN